MRGLFGLGRRRRRVFGQAAEIARCLLDRGMRSCTPVRVVENASLPGMREYRMTLAELPRLTERGINGPALIMLGEVFAAKAAAVAHDVLPFVTRIA